MPRFRVSFDGKSQETFDNLEEATSWAEEVSETGRMTWVIETRLLRVPQLRAVFPLQRAEEGAALFRVAKERGSLEYFPARKRRGKKGQ